MVGGWSIAACRSSRPAAPVKEVAGGGEEEAADEARLQTPLPDVDVRGPEADVAGSPPTPQERAEVLYEESKESAAELYETSKDRAAHWYETSKERAQELYDEAKDAVEPAAEYVSDKARKALERGKRALREAVQALSEEDSGPP